MSDQDASDLPPNDALPARAIVPEWVIAIRPAYSRQIFAGTKLVELRRRAPRWAPGQVVHVYESSPTMALVGRIVVGRIVTASPDEIWQRYAAVAGIDHAGYDTYMRGAATCAAIELATAELLDPVPLAVLRARGFTPPQSWCRVRPEVVAP